MTIPTAEHVLLTDPLDPDAPSYVQPTIEDHLIELKDIHQAYKTHGRVCTELDEHTFAYLACLLKLQRYTTATGIPDAKCCAKTILLLVENASLALIDTVGATNIDDGSEEWHSIPEVRLNIMLAAVVCQLDQMKHPDMSVWLKESGIFLKGLAAIVVEADVEMPDSLPAGASRCLRYLALKHPDGEVRKACRQLLEASA